MNRFLILLTLFIGLNVNSQISSWKIYPNFGFDMGGAVPFPFSNIPDDASGTPEIEPFLGLGAKAKFTPRWSVALDINYHQLAFTANADVISQEYWSDDQTFVQYFSGETHTDVELRFVEFPLSAYYHLGEKWSLILGGYYSITLEGFFETQGRKGISTHDKTISDNPNLPGPFEVDYSFSEYLDKYDAGMHLGYEFKIIPRLLLTGRLHVGFKSIFMPEFTNLKYEMYQVRLSTGLSFVLFDSE